MDRTVGLVQLTDNRLQAYCTSRITGPLHLRNRPQTYCTSQTTGCRPTAPQRKQAIGLLHLTEQTACLLHLTDNRLQAYCTSETGCRPTAPHRQQAVGLLHLTDIRLQVYYTFPKRGWQATQQAYLVYPIGSAELRTQEIPSENKSQNLLLIIQISAFDTI